MSEQRTYPHCDPRVLHAPGECKICDEYAVDLQQGRIDEGVNFTGHTDTDKKPCPADAARGVARAHMWSGNTPRPAACKNCGHPQPAHQTDESCIFAPGSTWTPRSLEEEQAVLAGYYRTPRS